MFVSPVQNYIKFNGKILIDYVLSHVGQKNVIIKI
jgi:hypothetical protein